MSSPVTEVLIIGGLVGKMALKTAKNSRKQARNKERRRIEDEQNRQRAAEQKAIENQRRKELARQKQIEEQIAKEAQRRKELEEKRRIAEQEARELKMRQEQELREWESSRRAQQNFQSFAENSMKSRLLNQIQIARNLLVQYDDMYDGFVETADILEEETGKSNELQNMVNSLHEEIIDFLKREQFSDADTLDTLEEKSKKWEDKLSQIQKTANRIEHIAEPNNQDLFSIMSEKVNTEYYGESEPVILGEETENTENFNEIKKSILLALDDLEDTPELPENLRKRIASSRIQADRFENVQMLSNFRSLTLIPLAEEISLFKEKYEEYLDLRLDYEAICVLRGIQPVQTTYSAAMIPFLKAEIQKIETEMDHEDEQAYIQQCLDEVMSDMGYEVLGHRNVEKKNGKKFSNDLYSFSDGTAVNITSSSDGMIAMEFGGIDTIDRIPDETERSQLAEEAGIFCEKQKEIEARLESKGVLVGKRISILPPDGAYAQIINISDYELEKEPERFEIKRKKKSGTLNKRSIGE